MSIDIDKLLNGQRSKAIDWKWSDQFVQADTNEATSGLFVSADSSLICVGPPRVDSVFNVIKVGMSPSFSLSQQIPQNRITEIGSRRVHIVNGTPQGAGNISRFLYNGPTMLRMSYGLLFDKNNNLTKIARDSILLVAVGNEDALIKSWSKMAKMTDRAADAHKRTNFWISCWDNKLKFPIGLAIYHQDTAGNYIGGYYIEGVKYNAHGISQQSPQMVLAESLSFSFDRVTPLAEGPGSS